MLRGDVACLVAGVGILAFVVTTNAERRLHQSVPADPPVVVAASGRVDRSSGSTKPHRIVNLAQAYRSSSAGGQGSGSPSGGIAGGDPATSQSSGFEVGEGFAVGFIDGQIGWRNIVNQPGGLESAVEAHVDSLNPATGDQHLRLDRDPDLPNTLFIGAISPTMGPFASTSSVVSVDIFITGTGRDYEVAPQSASEELVVTSVRFRRLSNTIEVLDDIGAGGVFIDTGATWIPDQYVNLTIDLDAVAGTVTISYNNVIIYTMASLPFATAVQETAFVGLNGAAAGGHADFDNYDVAGGPPPTGACCNLDGDNGCAIITPEECAGIVDAFYFGDGSLCIDCPFVDPSCGPGAGDCLVAHAGPGCDDIECCALVCEAIPTCCLPAMGWDEACAAAANETFCVPDSPCGVPGTGSCTDGTNTTQFCDDTCGANGPCVGCCDIVCAFDPFCCNITWDNSCNITALDLCGCEAADIPTNDECVDAIELFAGPAIAIDNFCGTAGLPDHATCNDMNVTGLGIDVWYFHIATIDGALIVTPTPDDDATWNTQLAVYEGCDCNALTDPPLVCALIDDSAIVPVTKDTCYTIRLGGTFDGATGSGLLQLTAVPDACVASPNDCLASSGTAGCSDVTCCAVVCLSMPSCCEVAWDQACADAGQVSCAPLPCPALDTSAANVDEAEVCGLDVNGGCNSDPAVFTEIVSGDVIAGSAWADMDSRDTDWYRLTIDPAADVNLDGMVDIHYSLVSEMPLISFLIRDLDPACGPDGTDPDLVASTAYAQSCSCINPGVGTVAVTDAIYVFAGAADVAGTPILQGFPCAVAEGPTFGNTYLLSVDVTDNGDPSPQVCGVAVTPCPWDCQAVPDQNVGINDFLDLLGQWSQVGTPCDFGDGPPGVGVEDFLSLLGHWGPCP